MNRARGSYRKIRVLHLVVITLALTNVSVAQIGDFRLLVFWPILMLAMLTSTNFKDGTRLPRTAIAFLLVAVLMQISGLANLSKVKATSLALSLGWIVYWYWLVTDWRPRLALNMEQTLSWVAKIYFGAILLSALLVFLGWKDSPLPNFLGWIYDLRQGHPRFYGPTSEPSYAALILGITGLGILRARIGHGLPARSRSSDLVFIGILISLLFLRSIYSIVVALVLLPAFAMHKTTRPGSGMLLALVLVPFLPFFAVLIPDDSRFGIIFAQLSQLSFLGLREVDSSAYMRFGPSIEMLLRVSLDQPEFWIGHGAGSAQTFFGNIFSVLLENNLSTMNFGFFPSFVFDYGVLASLVMLIYLFAIAHGAFSLQTRFLIFIALFNCNFNTAIFWYLITVVLLTSPHAIAAGRKRLRSKISGDNSAGVVDTALPVLSREHTRHVL